MNYYATKETIKFLKNGSDKKVLLFGGNTGHTNYGDVLQLKNEIQFHQAKTHLAPVILFRYSDPLGASAAAANETFYNLKHIIYMTPEDLGRKSSGLYKMTDLPAGIPMHIYGGGYLNSFWGKDIIKLIRDILGDFEVSEYVFSGQQIAKELTPDLKALFDFKSPVLFGTRDLQSFKYVKKILPKDTRFSFDDVTEILSDWSPKKKPKKAQKKHIVWHFNTTHYTASNIMDIKERILRVKEKYPGRTHLIVQAFNDREAKDSLQTIIDLESHFPLHDYKVINLSQIALEDNSGAPAAIARLAEAELAIVSSYHVAMTLSYMDVPVYLMAANSFYQQKAKGLGYSANIEKFLRKPAINLRDFREEREQRKAWLKELVSAFTTE